MRLPRLLGGQSVGHRSSGLRSRLRRAPRSRPSRAADRILTDDATGLCLSIWVIDGAQVAVASLALGAHVPIGWFNLDVRGGQDVADESCRT